ncbi:TlpA family protein disulfide reductase [Ferruginibacter sp. SUN106]|uniref:TlpA family protein disulfide reductase n=1 Tax=Ferruginibacter sp. SUN106 TaxID=2978348 RepID=UPI003D36E31B
MKKVFFVVIVSIAAISVKAQIKVGAPVPEISLPNVKDSMVSLSSFKGKVVLIDFWASWCGPCRESNPGVVKLYNKYKDKGFEVFSISIDNKKNDWIKAIKHDKIKYTQVNDNGGWNGKVPAAFGVEMIPTSFLLDKNGNVVAIDAEGKKLDKLVSELLQ